VEVFPELDELLLEWCVFFFGAEDSFDESLF
jgi:hypothetical protein